MNKMIFLIAFQLLFFYGYSQNDLLLFGPDNVDVHLTEQFAYYVGFYTVLLDDLEKEKSTCEGKIEREQSKEKTNRAVKIHIRELENELSVLKHKIFRVDECIKKWTEYSFKNENDVYSIYDDDYCFDVTSKENVYSHKEYLIFKIGPSTHVSWNEVLDMEIIETEAGVTTVWRKVESLNTKGKTEVKWCLVEVPKFETSSTCAYGFTEEEGKCFRKVVVENEHPKESRLIFRAMLDKKEIKVVELKKVDCN